MHERVVITGGSGFLGTAIAARLKARGVSVTVLDLVPPKDTSLSFVKANLAQDITKHPDLANPTAVINLAGAPIFGRWTDDYKKVIYNSRVRGTQNLVAMFDDALYRPARLVSASAVGVYGDRGDEQLTVDAPAGDGFLAAVARDWETAARRAQDFHVQTTIIRNGHILGRGGLLGVLAPFYKLGIGGPIGNGEQWMPWIHLDDCVELYVRAALGEETQQTSIAAAPEQVQNKTLSKAFAKTLHRPHLFSIPVWALRLLYKDLGKEMVASQRVISDVGEYTFAYPKLTEALADIW